MKKILVAVFVLFFSAVTFITCASGQDYGYKGSFSGYDVTTEMAVLKMIESQTDPETDKVIIGGMALKFEYFSNALDEVDGYHVAAVYFSDKEDKYLFDYYVEGDRVVKIMLFSKNGEYINKQVYPDEKGDCSEGKKK